jgi:glycyl-tRNA synthetase
MEQLVTFCKTRGFVFPGSEIYGGLANSWDYGPLGVELKQNIKAAWWKKFVTERLDMVGLDAALLMNPKVWEASGHVATFTDPLVECKECHERFRVDHLIDGHELDKMKSYLMRKSLKEFPDFDKNIEYLHELRETIEEASGETNVDSLKNELFDKLTQTENIKQTLDDRHAAIEELSGGDKFTSRGAMYLLSKIKCNNCGALGAFTKPASFNLMMRTWLGAKQDDSATVYFRPETAQAMFVQFNNIVTASRRRVPFGVAQIGKAFRNEITPGNFIFRTREFEQMEIEYFVHPDEWEKHFELWLKEMHSWLADCGISQSEFFDNDIEASELAHYSKRTVDIEYNYPFGRKELYGLAYRTDFDLKSHTAGSGEDLLYTDPQTGEKYVPHVIEPSFGVDRTFLAVMHSAYHEEEVEGETRVVLRLPKHLAPVKIAVLPLSKKEELAVISRPLAESLAKAGYRVEYDETQSIGKRYRRQDEIGTPYCVTVDFETINDQAVTVRDRDTMEQVRVPIAELGAYFATAFSA